MANFIFYPLVNKHLWIRDKCCWNKVNQSIKIKINRIQTTMSELLNILFGTSFQRTCSINLKNLRTVISWLSLTCRLWNQFQSQTVHQPWLFLLRLLWSFLCVKMLMKIEKDTSKISKKTKDKLKFMITQPKSS